MSATTPELGAIAHLLPEERVGRVTAIQPMPKGPSGSGVYAVTSERGELVLRVQPAQRDAALAGVVDQLRVLHGLDPDGPRGARGRGVRPRRVRGAAGATGLPGPRAHAGPRRIESALASDGRRVVSHNDLNRKRVR